jgi:hypothetical protein
MEEPDIDEVLDICIAYEQGYLAGQALLSSESNAYNENTKTFYAWLFGHNNSLTKEILEVNEEQPH